MSRSNREAIPGYFLNQKKMNRKQFLKTSAVALAGIAVSGSFLEVAKKHKRASGPTVNFTLDLNDSKNAALASSGGYIYNQGVIIARINDMTDVYSCCPNLHHQGCTVTFATGSESFVCPATEEHTTSTGTSSPPSTLPIKRYTITRNGNF